MTEASIVSKPEFRQERLGDGNIYFFEPPSLGLLDRLEREFAKSSGVNTSMVHILKAAPFGAMVTTLWLRLQKKHPEITRDQVGELINSKETMTIAQNLFNEVITNLVQL